MAPLALLVVLRATPPEPTHQLLNEGVLTSPDPQLPNEDDHGGALNGIEVRAAQQREKRQGGTRAKEDLGKGEWGSADTSPVAEFKTQRGLL